MIKEDNLPPIKWVMGRVCELHMGKDNKCRVASIKTSNGICKRAVSRLCILPIEE